MNSKLLLAALLVISFSSGSYGYDVFGREYVDVALNPPPEDAIEIGREYLQELVDLHFEEDVAIGEPIPLLAPDLTIWAYAYPATLGTFEPVEVAGVFALYEELREAEEATSSYYSEYHPRFYEDMEYAELCCIKRERLVETLKTQFIVVSFVEELPIVLGYERSSSFCWVTSEEFKTYSEINNRAELVGHSFLPDIYDLIELTSIYQDGDSVIVTSGTEQSSFDDLMSSYPVVTEKACMEELFSQYLFEYDLYLGMLDVLINNEKPVLPESTDDSGDLSDETSTSCEN